MGQVLPSPPHCAHQTDHPVCFADRKKLVQELLAFKGAGGSAVVQWTPLGLNRRMTALGKISAETGVHVVAATGFHRMEHYAPHWRGIEDQLAFLRFLREEVQPQLAA